MIRNNEVNFKYSYNPIYEYFYHLFNTYIYSINTFALILLIANFSDLSHKFY